MVLVVFQDYGGDFTSGWVRLSEESGGSEDDQAE